MTAELRDPPAIDGVRRSFVTARGVRDHAMGFWDAQIWAAARLNQIGLVLSEDLQDRAVVEGVRFVNPFVDGFRLQDWAA